MSYDDHVQKMIKKYEDKGHVLKRYDEESGGDVNVFAHAAGIHNGPACIKCGYSACWHCNPEPPECTGK